MSLARIARTLGLSVTTVSRALAGYSDVSAATRARVEAEAARIDYRPNQMARRLRTGRAGAVGVVLPSGPGQFDDPFFMRMLACIGPSLAKAGLDLLVTAARPGEDELRTYRQLTLGRRVDGMIVARTRRDDPRIRLLLLHGTPFVTHGRSETQQGFASLDIDGEAAGRLATERLIAFGHRRIALINADASYMYANYREAGWRGALDHAGLAPGPVRQAEPTEENGMRLGAELLAAADAPTALLCATDRLAVGALHAIRAAGLRPGHDVSVIGHDDLPLATYTDPPLTTVAQPIERAAQRMVEMLLAILDGADPASLSEVWLPTLVPRASDGPPPPQAQQRASQETIRQKGTIHDGPKPPRA